MLEDVAKNQYKGKQHLIGLTGWKVPSNKYSVFGIIRYIWFLRNIWLLVSCVSFLAKEVLKKSGRIRKATPKIEGYDKLSNTEAQKIVAHKKSVQLFAAEKSFNVLYVFFHHTV